MRSNRLQEGFSALKDHLNTLPSRLRKTFRNPICYYCQKTALSKGLLCPGCEAHLEIRKKRPLANPIATSLTQTTAAPYLSPYLSRHAASRFNLALKQLLYPYKFYGKKENASLLADILSHYWSQQEDPTHPTSETRHPKGFLPRNTLVTPIPSRWPSNHVAVFAKRFAKESGFRYAEALLTCAKDSMPQHRVSNRRQRWENIAGCFKALGPSIEKYLSAKHLNPASQEPTIILLIDDIITTGATLTEASHTLKTHIDAAYQKANPSSASPLFYITGLALCHIPLTQRKSRHQPAISLQVT